MANNKGKKKLSKAGKGLLVVIIAVLVVLVAFIVRPKTTSVDTDIAINTSAPVEVTATPKPTMNPELEGLEEDYMEKAQVNSEYIGVLKFDSGIVEQNVVQYVGDNLKYERTSWDLQESSQGAAFIDYRNQFTDQNLMIYGHYVYYDDAAMFSKLELLMDESNYEANKELTLTIGPDQIRHYVVTDVFYYNVNSDSPDYHEPNYTEEEFNTYYNLVKEADFYDTGESITYDDSWLTLQTCVRNHDELREIIICKEVERITK